MSRVRIGIAVLLISGVALMAVQVPRILAEGSLRMLLAQSEELREDGSIDESIVILNRAIEKASSLTLEGRLEAGNQWKLSLLAVLGDLQMEEGRFEDASQSVKRMLETPANADDKFGAFNTKNLDVLVRVVSGTATAEEVRAVISALNDLVGETSVDPESAATTYGDLFLALRAAGDAQSDAPGSARDYVGAARLLDAYERSGQYALTPELLNPAAKDLKKSAHRRILLQRLPGMPAEIVALTNPN
jgi:hypothetical protein